MGLGISVQSQIPSRGLLRRRPDRDTLWKQIGAAIGQGVREPLLQAWIRATAQDDSIFVHLHPAEEDLQFTLTADHTLVASAKTSSAGPGYHAFLVDLLDRVGAQCGLAWQWHADDADETGYATKRDFRALQDEMAKLMLGIGRHIVEMVAKGDHTSLYINMPIGEGPVNSEGVLGPTGPLPISWWRELSQNGRTSVDPYGRRFYAWWDQGFGASFYEGLGRYLLWCNIPWHPPTDQSEHDLCVRALEAWERAQEIDSSIQVPHAELAELQELLSANDDENTPIPHADRIGYRRGPMRRDCTGSWTMELPGYYYCSSSEDGTTLSYHFRDRAIHCSSFSAPPKPGAHPDILPEKRADEIAGAEVFDVEYDGHKGWALFRHTTEDDGSYWVLQGFMARGYNLATITFCFQNPAERDWALRTFRTLSYPGSDVETP